jgi:ABC-type transport system involved in multi-copper enzyme maturation permease subunit
VIERLENPVFRQSSRQRMRGARTYGCLMAYLLALGLVVVISYDQFMAVGVRRSTAGLAQTLFETLVATQWFLVAFITPALTSSAITVEREQRTYDLLMMTPMSRMAIVWGKFASAVAFVAVMILCGMPLVAVLFLMGGVDTGVMLERYAGMLLTGALLAAFGLMMSAICSNTTLANVLTYGILASVYFAGIVFGIALVLSRAFRGASTSVFLPGIGFTSWPFWLLTAVSVLLTLAILLQVAANYLLPDARQGAWKTRLLTALLHLLSLFAAMLTAKRAAFSRPCTQLYGDCNSRVACHHRSLRVDGGATGREKMVAVAASAFLEGGDGTKRIALSTVAVAGRSRCGPIPACKDAFWSGGVVIPCRLRLVVMGVGVFRFRCGAEPMGGAIPAGRNAVSFRANGLQCNRVFRQTGRLAFSPQLFGTSGTVQGRPQLCFVEHCVRCTGLDSGGSGLADTPEAGTRLSRSVAA